MLPSIKNMSMQKKPLKLRPGSNNSAISELKSIKNANSISSIGSCNSSIYSSKKTSTVIDEIITVEELPRAIGEILFIAISHFPESILTTSELTYRAHNLRINEAAKRSLLDTLIGIFKPALKFSNVDEKQYGTFIPTTLSDSIPTVTEINAAIEKRQNKLKQKALDNIVNLINSNERIRQLTALYRLVKLLQTELPMRVQDIEQLRYANFIAHPHIIKRKPLCSRANRCIFCAINFSSIEMLQAHLITMKHSLLTLTKDWAKMVDMVRTTMQHSNISYTDKSSIKEKTEIKNEIKESPMDDLNNNDDNSERTTIDIETRLVTSPVSKCLFCDKIGIMTSGTDMHKCTLEHATSIEKEIAYFNEHGCPLVCLLCNCRRFSSPDALQMHLVGQHCANANPRFCPLCEIELFQLDTLNDNFVQKIILERHLQETHLPLTEMMGRLVLSLGSIVAPKQVLMAAPPYHGITRAYRCGFLACGSAGKGAAFPFADWHWRNQKMSTVFSETPNVDNTVIPSRAKEGGRSTRNIARLAALVNPREFYCRLRQHWQGTHDSCKSSIFSLISTQQPLPWCSGIPEVTDLAQMTAHVIGCHGGSIMLQPGLREAAIEENKEKRIRHRQVKRHVSVSNTKIKEVHSSIQWKRLNGLEALKKYANTEFNIKDASPVASKDLIDLGTSSLKMSFGFKKQNKHSMQNQEAFSVYSTDNFAYKRKLLRLARETSLNFVETSGASSIMLDEAMGEAFAGSLGMNMESNHNSTCKAHPETPRDEMKRLNYSNSKTMETIFCHLCLEGPFDRETQLNTHLDAMHVDPLRLRLKRLFNRGSMGHAIDPTRTCFQCYRTLSSFVALQVHIVVSHGSVYPFVCGLCNEPVTFQGNNDPLLNKFLPNILSEAYENIEADIRAYLDENGIDKPIDAIHLLGKLDTDVSRLTLVHQVKSGLELAIAATEITQVKSAVRAGVAALKVPAIALLTAIKRHEQLHVDQVNAKLGLHPVLSEDMEKETMSRMQAAFIKHKSNAEALAACAEKFREIKKNELEEEQMVVCKHRHHQMTVKFEKIQTVVEAPIVLHKIEDNELSPEMKLHFQSVAKTRYLNENDENT